MGPTGNIQRGFVYTGDLIPNQTYYVGNMFFYGATGANGALYLVKSAGRLGSALLTDLQTNSIPLYSLKITRADFGRGIDNFLINNFFNYFNTSNTPGTIPTYSVPFRAPTAAATGGGKKRTPAKKTPKKRATKRK
jgi:hypothetical protein